MSFDLFSSMDFSFTKFLILKFIVWLLSLMLIFNLVFFKKKSFLYRTMVEVDNLIFGNLSEKLQSFIFLNWSLITIFEIVFLSKLTGLFPYMFGWTPHMLIILIFSFALWLTMKFSFLMFDSVSFFSHLVPLGTPLILGMFLSMIELMSNFIRPLTLSLRLGIKITTGHMLLGLMSIMGVQFKFNLLLVGLGSFYFLFELFVMFIQAVVYTLLLSQYSEEIL